jgi:hypothetical protein
VVSDFDDDEEADGEDVVDDDDDADDADDADEDDDNEGIGDEGIFVIIFFDGGVLNSSVGITAPLDFPSRSDMSGISDISSFKASVLLGCSFNAALRSKRKK